MFVLFWLVLFLLYVGSVAFHSIPGNKYFSVLFLWKKFYNWIIWCWEFIVVGSSCWIVSTKWLNLKWPWEPIVGNSHFYFQWWLLKIKNSQMHLFVFELCCDYHFMFLNKWWTRYTISTYNKIVILHILYIRIISFSKPK